MPQVWLPGESPLRVSPDTINYASWRRLALWDNIYEGSWYEGNFFTFRTLLRSYARGYEWRYLISYGTFVRYLRNNKKFSKGRMVGVIVWCKYFYGFSDFQEEKNFKRFLTPYGQLHSEARGRRAIPQANSLILPEACQDSEMSENEVVGKSWTWTSLRARRHRVLPNLDREWYHVMASSASTRYHHTISPHIHILYYVQIKTLKYSADGNTFHTHFYMLL